MRISIESQGESYFPNGGKQPHLVNQIGQDNFALSVNVFIGNTGEAYTGAWTIEQSLLDDAGGIHSRMEKTAVPVTIPKGGNTVLGPLAVGQLPMKDVPTDKKSYGHRLRIMEGNAVIADQITPLAFDGTNTVFDGPTIVFQTPTATDTVAKAELTAKETRKASLETAIKGSTDEIAVLTPRILKLKGLLG